MAIDVIIVQHSVPYSVPYSVIYNVYFNFEHQDVTKLYTLTNIHCHCISLQIQDGQHALRSGAARLAITSFAIASVILMAAYPAQLFSVLTVRSQWRAPFQDLASMRAASYRLGALHGHAHEHYAKMIAGDEALIFNSTDDALHRMRTSQVALIAYGGFAADYQTARRDLREIARFRYRHDGKRLLATPSESFALFFRNDSDLEELFRPLTMQLLERGMVARQQASIGRQSWLAAGSDRSQGYRSLRSFQPITMQSFVSPFFLLTGGAMVALALLLVERAFCAFRRR